MKSILNFTDIAVEKLGVFMGSRSPYPKGVRITLSTRGCSGLSWLMDFVDEIFDKDDVVDIGGMIVYVDPKALLFILGTTVDYKQTELEEGFLFINPNEKARCGCGESFTI